MKIEIPYGPDKKYLILNDSAHFDLIFPNEIEVSRRIEKKIVGESLEKAQPLQNESYLNKEQTIGIVVNDPTRPLPNKLILPPLLEKLRNLGVLTSQISIYIATGTHKTLTKNDISDLLSPNIASNYRTYVHDCDNNDELTFLGESTRHTPIYINKKFNNCDVKIVIGNIEPHHFMGFSGGAKSAVIGLGGRKTIESNHSWIKDKNAKMGIFHTNPMRLDVEEIGRKIKIDFAWNFVLNSKKQIIYALFGDPYKVMLSGIEKSLTFCLIKGKAAYDLVIASPGGFPKDINLYQSQKAVTHACTFLKRNGVLILVAECIEGIGNEDYFKFLDGKESYAQVISYFKNQPFKIGPHKAFLMALQLKDHQIMLVSDLSPDIVRKMHLIPAKSISDALELAYKLTPGDRKIAVLPFATHIIGNQQADK